MGKFFTVTRHTVVALLLLASAALLVLSLPGSGWKALSVQTGSMKPAIDPGDLVLVHSVPVSELQTGDVITYASPKDPGATITHRIEANLTVSERGPGRFVTKGDANQSIDPIVVYQNQITGTVKATIPKMGFLFDWLRTWPGLITVIYFPALLIVIAEIKRLAKYYKTLIPYVAAGFDPNHKLSPQPTKALAKASMVAMIAGTGLIIPAAHAALMSQTTLSNSSISSVAPSTNTSNNTSINVTNDNSQAANSGNVSTNNNDAVGNVSTGNASNTNNTTTTIDVTRGGNTNTGGL